MEQTPVNSKQLWMNHRKLDEEGLIVPYPRQRQFNLNECVNSLENLLAKKQAEGLSIHYAHQFHFKDLTQLDFEIITYRGYLVGRCSKSRFDEQKNVKSGQLFLTYSIIRLDSSKIKCIYPYLLLFDIRMQAFPCETCQKDHFPRIYKSSFEAVRTEFVMEIANKIKFMTKYPNYMFQPHNFVSTRKHGNTPFLRLKFQDYQYAQYFEKSEQILINQLRIHCLKHDFDFEAVRFDEYCKNAKISEEQKQKLQKSFEHQELKVKTKYLCRKCADKIIWTTKNTVIIKYQIVKLTELSVLDNNLIYDSYEDFKKFTGRRIEEEKKKAERVDVEYFHNSFKLSQPDKLDKSLIREVQEYGDYKDFFQKFGRWHQQLKDYSYPYLVIVSINVPKMACTSCHKDKDGLIYVSNLVNYCNSHICNKIGGDIKYFHNKVSKNETK